MASLIRASNLWGYGDLIKELGADPQPFLSRFHIPQGVENEEDAFIPVEAIVRLLEASADELKASTSTAVPRRATHGFFMMVTPFS